MTAIHHTASTQLRPIATGQAEGSRTHRTLDRLGAGIAVLLALAVTALPMAWIAMLVVAAFGGSLSYLSALPLGVLAGALPFVIGAGLHER